MYLLTPDPNSPASQTSLLAAQTSVAAAGYSDETSQALSVSPLATELVYLPNASAINTALYCGYKEAYCNGNTEVSGTITIRCHASECMGALLDGDGMLLF